MSEFDPCTFDLGVHEREIVPGKRVRIYGPARSVVDVMRLRYRVGDPVALRALRRWVQRPEADLAELLDYARVLDVEGPVRQAVEVVLS
ncbi:MAG: hypothetical protein ACRDZ4_18680 [Egibacteraceae bacterium]